MKPLFVLFGLLVFATSLYAQVQPLVKNDKSSYFYAETNFKDIDTLALWNYKLDDTKSKLTDSILSEGSILFWRTRPLNDGISQKLYGHSWSPSIKYKIFNLSDSVYCIKLSKLIRYMSSCVPPDVGGDYFIIGKYIFLNDNVCLNCRKYDTGIDYCRPVINFVISKIDKNRVETLDEITGQFVIGNGNKQ